MASRRPAARALLLGALLACLLLPAGGAGEAAAAPRSWGDRIFDSARRDEDALLASERSMRYRDRWEAVIAKFESVAEKDPGSASAPNALYRAGDLGRKLYKRSFLKGDLERSLRSFSRLAADHRKNSLADDALLAKADVLETLGRKGEAWQVLRSMLDRYPGGDSAPKGKLKLAELASFAPPPPARQKPAHAVRPALPSKPATVTDVRTWTNPDHTRVVVYCTGPVKVKKTLLPANEQAGRPARISLDLVTAVLARGLFDPIPVKDGLLHQVRSSQNDRNTVRVVLDIDSIEDHLVFTMENPFRVVVDVAGKGGKVLAGGGAEAGPEGGAEGGSGPLSLAQQMGLGVKRIVLDPGHGGRDPGAIGPTGVEEKGINLSIAKRLRDLLAAQGFAVFLTRESDVFVPLEERPAFARDRGADLFISIHCNANRNRGMRGIATYFLGVAKDREASEAAMLENAISENTLGDLEQILLDLARSANLKESSALAERIQETICKEIRCRYSAAGEDNGVKQAPFYVLMGTTNSRRKPMPAVLVETSFISNAEEEKLLVDPAFQEALSQALAGGVKGYVGTLGAGSVGASFATSRRGPS